MEVINWTPPYLYEGWETDLERRTKAVRDEEIAAQRKRAEWWEERQKEMHAQGMHMPGVCPLCPPNVFYD